MDSNSAYHHLAYSPYSMNTSQAQNQQQQQQNQQTAYNNAIHSIYNYPQKPVISVSNVTDYSNYNNYLYQSTIATPAPTPTADTYNYYTANSKTPLNDYTSYYSTPASAIDTTAYQTYPSTVTPGSANEKAVNNTWNEILAAYSKDAYATLRAKDINSIKAQSNRKPSVTTPIPTASTTVNEASTTLRPKSINRLSQEGLKQNRHKSVYEYLTPENRMSGEKEKRFSLMENLNATESEKKLLNDNSESAATGQDLTKGSPLFMKIMSKLAELPDLSRKLSSDTTPPGAPGNSKSASHTQPTTTTASTISTDSKLKKGEYFSNSVNEKFNPDTTMGTNNTSFSLPSIKMTDKLLGSLNHNKTSVVVVRRTGHAAPEPTCSTPINNGSNFAGFETHVTAESKRLSVYSVSTGDAYRDNHTPGLGDSKNDQEQISSNGSEQTKPTVKLRPHTTSINYSNRYTSLIGTPSPGQDHQQQQSVPKQTNRSSTISKEIEDSLKNYFAYLNGISSRQPVAEAISRDASPTKKYSTVNPNNFNNQATATVTSQVNTNNDTHSVKHSKFATVNPSDLQKRVAEAFHSLKARREEEAKEPPQQQNLNTTSNVTEEIEQVADFSQSSNESITKFAESLRLKRTSLLYQLSPAQQPRSVEATAKVTSSYMKGTTATPVKQADSAETREGTRSSRIENNNNNVPRKQHQSPRQISREVNTRDGTKSSPKSSDNDGPKVKLRTRTRDSTQSRSRPTSSSNRRTLVHEDQPTPPSPAVDANPYSYRYNRMLLSRPKTEVKELIDRPARKLSTPPPTPPFLEKTDSPAKAYHYKQHQEKTKDSRPVSIATSIRSGKSEKPLRLHHGPPPPPGINSKRLSVAPSYYSTNTHATESRETSQAYDYERYVEMVNGRAPGYSAKRQTVSVEHRRAVGAAGEGNGGTKVPEERGGVGKAQVKEAAVREATKYGGRSTNLPQLGKIDYVYKTNDDQLMASFGSYSEPPKSLNNRSSKDSYKSTSRSPPVLNSAVPTKPTTQTANYNNNRHMNHQNGAINSNDNSSLWTSPKDIRNGKNFYENYSKENDKRKKEGNGFLMLLPGIAIPIDTDDQNSEEDTVSEDSD